MKDLGALMKQAQAMQQKLQEAQAKLAETEASGTSGGGMVTVTLQGSGELKGVVIDEDLFEARRGQVLSDDLIVAAHADAKRKLDTLQAETMKEIAGPFAGMPGFPKFSSAWRLPRDPEIERLIALLAKLLWAWAALGAAICTLALLKRRDHLMRPLAAAMAEAAERVRPCETCGALDTTQPCRGLRRP